MKQVKKLLIPVLFSSLIFANVSSLSVYAAGDIASVAHGQLRAGQLSEVRLSVPCLYKKRSFYVQREKRSAV